MLLLLRILTHFEEFCIDQNLVKDWSGITIAHHRLVDLEVDDVEPAAVCRMCRGNLPHLPCTTLRKSLELNGTSKFGLDLDRRGRHRIGFGFDFLFLEAMQ